MALFTNQETVMIEQQPNTEKIFEVLSEAKQYHREVLVKLIQANASAESLESMVSILQMLDAVGIRSSQPTNEEQLKNISEIHERLCLLEEATGNVPKAIVGHSIAAMAARPIRSFY